MPEGEKIKPLGIVKEFVSQNPRLFLLYCVFSIGIIINNIFIPRQYGSLINDVKDGTINRRGIIYIVILMILSQLFIFANDVMEIKLYPLLHSYLRDISLKHIIDNQSQSLSELEAGKFVSRITKFQTIFTGLFDDFRNNIILFGLVYIFAIGYTFKADPYLGMICSGLVGCILYTTYSNLSACSKYSIQRDNEYYKMVGGLDDIMVNITNVLNHNAYDNENKRLKAKERDIARYSSESLMCSYKYKLFVIVALCVATVLFVARCMYLSSVKQIDTKTILSLSIMMIYVFGIVLRNISIFKDISYRYSTLVEILKTINDTPSFNQNNGLIHTSECLDCLLSIVNLNVYCDNGEKHILKNLNLNVKRGESISITGEIGSGKSTLLKVLMKYRNNYSGTVYFNGVSYGDINSDQLRREIYYIDQKCVLFNRSIFENIVYGSSSTTTRDDVQRLISSFGLTSFFSRFSKGLDTQCGVGGGNLSGGERQVVMLLRMFIRKPQIVLLDEPTSAMDSATKKYVIQLLNILIATCTTICITHDSEISKQFHRNIHMRDGMIQSDTIRYNQINQIQQTRVDVELR